jgi:hypothetical protein
VGRALLWLLGGVVAFLLVAALLAPSGVVLRTLGLSVIALVPAGALVVLAGERRRRHRPDGHTPPPDAEPRDDPTRDGDR